MTKIWQVRASNPPAVQCWAGDYAVFNPRSGKTHILDTVAGEVLTCVAAGPKTDAEIAGQIASFLQVEPDGEVRTLVAATVDRLADLGLVEAAA